MTADNELSIKINELRRKKENFVNAGRESGDWAGVVDLLAHQYSDKTHFIFELLQNADDTEATAVVFNLYDDRLEFAHNGKRLFDYPDIESIVAIGKSTKKSNYTKIGKHGIGFKAVFAYTHKPRVYSGDIAFDIVDGIIPALLDKMPSDLALNETLFIFPFDNEKEVLPKHRFRDLVPAEIAHSEIYQRLQDLSLRTPLFLKHIESIKWKINGQIKGEIIRSCEPILNRNAFRVELVDTKSSESWIVFFRDIVIDEDEGKLDDEKKGTVKVAFLEKDSHIVKADNTELVVFFPTAVKTELGFIIHGPFKTTKARDNIKGFESNNRHTDPANNQIIKYAAQLAADSLEKLCKLELMNVSSYLVLPLRESDYSAQSFFRPVYDQVREALKTQSLLPAHNGGYFKAGEVKLAGVKGLIDLFSLKQLGTLFGKEELAWLDASITADSFPDFYRYLRGLNDGILVSPESLVLKLTADFLKEQPVPWVIQFIQYVEQGARHLRRVPFIRLQSSEQVALPENQMAPRSAYFAPKETSGLDLFAFPLVNAELAANESVRTYLEKEGIREIDAAAIVEKSILPKFQEEIFAENFDEKTYRSYLRCIVDAYNKSVQLTKIQLTNHLNTLPWLACIHASGKSEKIVWKKPGSVSLFTGTTDHKIWFDELENFDAYFLHSCIGEELSADLVKILAKPIDSLVKKRPLNDYQRHINIASNHGNHIRGLNGFDPDWKILGFPLRMHSNPKIEHSILLWKLLKLNSESIKGAIQKSSRQNFENPESEEKISEIGSFLSELSWLPDKMGKLHKPSELLLTDLPNEFDTTSVSAREVAEKLGMKKPGFEKAADELSKGNPRKRELLEWIANASEDDLEKFEKLKPIIVPPQPAPSFKELGNFFRQQRGGISSSEVPHSNYPLSNPERYQNKANQEVEEKVRQHESTPQTIRFSIVSESSSNQEARHFLYQQYQGKCQITGNTFSKASANANGDAENYFEACSLLSYSNANYLNDAGNMLCVSADTMAKLKNASFEWLDDLEAIIESFKNRQPAEIENVKANIKLAGEECVITWSERHFARLMALWNKAP